MSFMDGVSMIRESACFYLGQPCEDYRLSIPSTMDAIAKNMDDFARLISYPRHHRIMQHVRPRRNSDRCIPAVLPFERLGKHWHQTVRDYRDVLHLSLSRGDRLKWMKRKQLNRFRVFSCGWYVEAHRMYWERKNLNEAIYIYCTDGKGFYHCAGKNWTILPGDLLYCPPLAHHSYGADPHNPWTILWMHISGPDIDFYHDLFNFSPSQLVRRAGIRPRAISAFRTLFHFMKAPLSDARMDAISQSARLALSSLAMEDGEEVASEEIGAGVQCVTEYMETHMAEIADFATWLKLFGGSRSHFQHQFRRSTGHPPKTYFLHLKIRKACSLLAASPLRVAEIAERVGFSDPYYFSRMFRRVTGHCPRQYRVRIAQHETKNQN